MYIIYNIIGLVFAIAFLAMIFIVAWYIALPLLIIALLIWVCQQFAFKIQEGHRFIIKKREHKKSDAKIIDVEWTEVK